VTNSTEDDNREYVALVNNEGQHCIWLAFHQVPAGWSVVGPRGKRQECLSWIGANWTDMRPKSLIAAMEKHRTGQ
jgi:MbtH protein